MSDSVPIKDISNFPNHPYKVIDNESMNIYEHLTHKMRDEGGAHQHEIYKTEEKKEN